MSIALTLDDCIAISNARNEPLEDTIRRINKLDRYESKPVIGRGPKATPKAKPAPKPKAVKKPKAQPKADKKAVKLANNWAGTPMKADKGTASSGQVKWLVANAGKTQKQAATMSMVEASNLRAKLTGKLA